MGRIQKRGKGEHNPLGFTKLKIVEHVYNNISGVTTSDLREYLREEFNVREKTGIDDHLAALKEKHYINGILEDDQENHWYPPSTLDYLPGLLSDREVWGVLRVDKKPVADVVDWLQVNSDNVVKLFNTKFFNKSVKPLIIQKLCSSPPFLDECNTMFGMNLKSVRKSKADERALRDHYTKALSASPTVMIHIFIPSRLIRAGLYAIQINSRMYTQIAETVIQDNPDQYPFVRDQLKEVRQQLQSWKETNHDREKCSPASRHLVWLLLQSYSRLIRAGLYAIQINSRMYTQIAETVIQDNPDQYPFVRDQLKEVRQQLQSWKETDHVPGEMFTSIEAFGLASVYLGMAMDQVQFPHLSEKIEPILSDTATNITMGKYLKNPFFSVEFVKFMITLTAVWGAFSAQG